MSKEPQETRGMSLRELVLELRQDVKRQNRDLSKRPTRLEIYGTAGTASAFVFGVLKVLG